MASTNTPNLDLIKPTPGTAEPFRITDWNQNWDKVDNVVPLLIDPAIADLNDTIAAANDATATNLTNVTNAIAASELATSEAIAALESDGAAAIVVINDNAADAVAANDAAADAALDAFNSAAAADLADLETAVAAAVAGGIPLIDGGSA